MAAKPRQPTPEEQKAIKDAQDKLIKDGKVKEPEGKHRKTS